MKLRSHLRTHFRSAFTLMEIMLVVMIIALLAGLAIFNLGDVFGTAQDAAAQANMNSIKIALTTYRGTTGNYPTTGQGLNALVTQPEGIARWRPAMQKLDKDPWGTDFGYEYPGRRNPNAYDLYSYGADKLAGTKDDVWPN
jgi:general secretion pathway protein G